MYASVETRYYQGNCQCQFIAELMHNDKAEWKFQVWNNKHRCYAWQGDLEQLIEKLKGD
jgi:hypothetical protein